MRDDLTTPVRADDLRIRMARAEDAPCLHDLHTQSVRALYAGHYSDEMIDGWLLNRTPGGYLRPIQRGTLFVAEQHGRKVRLEVFADGLN